MGHAKLAQILRRSGMIPLLRVFAYICIWTTPFQVGFILWGIGIVALTDYSILSLSNIEFLGTTLAFYFLFEWFTHGSGMLS
ncbi:MAG: hypothetical protein CM1200mP8_3040 [Chloroflexota bacterium]|nr:MAG: hypothetical protein CM1200mP8_3040 [Chloroflexota bacterium]